MVRRIDPRRPGGKPGSAPRRTGSPAGGAQQPGRGRPSTDGPMWMVGDRVVLPGTPQPRFERATVAEGGGLSAHRPAPVRGPGAGGLGALPPRGARARVEITTPLVNGAVARRSTRPARR